MSYFLAALIVLIAWHFVYEGILAPSLRLKLRFELFALRDELRLLKVSCGSSLDDKHFHYLQDSINAMISLLPRIDLSTLVAAQSEFERNKEFRAHCEARSKVLDDCNIPQARDLRRKSLRLVGVVLGVNSGGWAIFVLPVIGCIGSFQVLKSRIRLVASLPESDLNRVANPAIGSAFA
jgi:hypothetical protein